MIPDGFRQALDRDGEPHLNYWISADGRVGSTQAMGTGASQRIGTFHLLKPATNASGYYFVNLSHDDVHRLERVHSLVARSWIGMPPAGFQMVNHKDGVKKNVHFSNLEWTDHDGNSAHAAEYGLSAHGERNARSTLSEENVCSIRIMSAAGWTGIRLAKLFSVTKSGISAVVRGENWTRTKGFPIKPSLPLRKVVRREAYGHRSKDTLECGHIADVRCCPTDPVRFVRRCKACASPLLDAS